MKYDKNYVIGEIINNPDLKMIGFFGQKSESDLERSFSNFYQADFEAPLIHKGKNSELHKFTCSEQHFMYQKAVVFDDIKAIDKILINNKNGNYYKSLGKQVGNQEINPDSIPFDKKLWDEKSYDCMLETLNHKFTNNKLKNYLLSTGDAILIEASPFDNIWGIKLGKNLRDGTYDKEEKWKDPNKWNGSNKLGFALMQTRDLIKKQKKD